MLTLWKIYKELKLHEFFGNKYVNMHLINEKYGKIIGYCS
jgi:hypothetical protein